MKMYPREVGKIPDLSVKTRQYGRRVGRVCWLRAASRSSRAQGGSIGVVTLPTSAAGASFLRGQHFGDVGVLGHGDVEPADHHLLPSLIAPADRLRRIGIRRIVG